MADAMRVILFSCFRDIDTNRESRYVAESITPLRFTLFLCVSLYGFQDEWDDDETKSTYYFNSLPRQIEVDPEMIHNPQYSKLRPTIE